MPGYHFASVALLRMVFVLGAVACCIALPGTGHALGESADKDENMLRVMTYNIRYDNPADGPNAWPHRRDAFAKFIDRQQPDVVGFQEALHGQVQDLENRLPQYAWHGVGRADGEQGGEYSPIFYRRDRFEMQEQGTFWLSETPDKAGSVGWDAALPRIVTWVLLKDGTGENRLLVLNTHFDHRGVTARHRSAELIVEKLAELPTADAVVVLGDFNFLPDTPPYGILEGPEVGENGFPLRDAIAISASEPTGPDSTWNAFQQIVPGRRIDFVFVGGKIQVASHDTLDPRHEGRFLSDHLPVRVDLKWE